MATSEHKYLSDFARRYHGEGVAEGRAEGARAALLTVIAARGVALRPEDRERIAGCVDVAILDAWVARAVHAATAGDVFGD
jgi:hypothetical protein